MIPEIELQTLAKIKAFQERELRKALQYLSEHSPFYKRLFATNKIDVSKILTLEDLTKLPTTSKDDLQNHNDDFLCVPKQSIIDYATTSGTLGDPVTIAMTDADLERLAYNEAISFSCSGMTNDDTLQLMTTMDRTFMAGLAYFLGARKLGTSIIRVGTGVPELQWNSIQKYKPTYLVGVPSFVVKLIAYAKQQHINLEESGVRAIICIGEPIRNQSFSFNSLGKQITDQWNVNLYSTYASTEMSTAFTECKFHQGGHHHPELIIVEVLNDYEKPVQNGEIGELTITTLGVEAMPLLRYKTGDMVIAHHGPCDCGRITMRLGPVVGRKQQMIKYKGTTFYPPALVNVLNKFTELDAYLVEISNDQIGMDQVQIKIATAHPSEALLTAIQEQLSIMLRVKFEITCHSLDELRKLQDSNKSRKHNAIIDNRLKFNNI